VKNKWFLIFGLPAFSLLVVMAGEGLLFRRPIVIRWYVTMYVAFVAVTAFSLLRKDREQ
jgi:hypothetical protein